MEAHKPIGGYFELELGQHYNNIPNTVEALHCARTCLRLIIRYFKIKQIYAPTYTCHAIDEVLRQEGCEILHYHIREDFMPDQDFPENAYVLYTDYFGVCSNNVRTLAKKHIHLIVDSTMNFNMPVKVFASFNSLRKFFGVPDGAFLSSESLLYDTFRLDRAHSYDRCSHLLKRLDVGPEFGFDDAVKNDRNVEIEEFFSDAYKSDVLLKLFRMSKLTTSIYECIDVKAVQKIRHKNFKILDDNLGGWNKLKPFKIDKYDMPVAYPFFLPETRLKQWLIDNKIYVPSYWGDCKENSKLESDYENYIVALPIDQRYNEDDMLHIVHVIRQYIFNLERYKHEKL